MTIEVIPVPEPLIVAFVVLSIIAILTLIAAYPIVKWQQRRAWTPPVEDGCRILSPKDRDEIVRTVKDAFSNRQDPKVSMRALELYTGVLPLFFFEVQRAGPILANLSPPGKEWVQFRVAFASDPTKTETITVWLDPPS